MYFISFYFAVNHTFTTVYHVHVSYSQALTCFTVWIAPGQLQWFLPRDAMLARYTLSSCVRPSVCPSQAATGRIELVLSWRFPSTYLTLFYNEIWVSPEICVLPSGTLSQTPDLENFATTSRSRCQQNSSSTVELVDDTYTTVDESRLCTTSRSTVTL